MDSINCLKFSSEKRERAAWYMYDWANSVYVNTGVQMFMPILMSNLFGQDFFGYWVSFSVFVQCIVFISCSALADFGEQRKRLLAFFSITGSISTCLFWFVKSPHDQGLAVFLLVVSNVAFGASFVMYNAYLSPIAADHEDVKSIIDPEKRREKQQEVEDDVSNKGYQCGYYGGLLMTIINLAYVFANPAPKCAPEQQKKDTDNLNSRANLLMAGLWWGVFSIFVLCGLKSRPGPPLPNLKAYIVTPWKRLWYTFRDIKHLPNLGRFLLLYFVYSDGYSAIGTLGVLFALNEVAVPQALLVLLLVETQLCALTGCILFAKIQKWLQTSKGIPVHRSAIYIISINLFIMGLLPIYGLLGAIQAMPFGLKTASEVFIFGGIYGLQIGAVQTYSRSVFSSMVPKGFECTFFGAYEVTDKGSSWVAPLIAALIMSSTKTICGVQKDGNVFQLTSLAKCVLNSDTSTVCPSTNMTKVDAACGSTKNSTNWVDAAGLAELLAAGAQEHCSTGGSVRLALVAIMFFLIVPIPFLLKYVNQQEAWKEAEDFVRNGHGLQAAALELQEVHPENENIRLVGSIQSADDN